MPRAVVNFLAAGIGIEDELQQPGAITDVDEDQTSVVAAAVHPAGDAQRLPDAFLAQVARPRLAVLVRARGLHPPATSSISSSALATER